MFNVPSFFGFKGGSQTPFQFTVDTTKSGTSASDQFTLPLTTSTGLDCFVYWGDGSYDNITSHTAPEVTHTYPSGGTYTIKITGDLLGWRFNNGGDKLKMGEIQKWGVLNISTDAGFYGCSNLTASATDAPLITTSSFQRFFEGCDNFNSNIGNWDTSSITNMSYMFNGADLFNNGGSSTINNWDTSNVTTMYAMFLRSAFNQDISSWDTSSVTNMANMFEYANSFNEDISAWDVSSVTNMSSMFKDATSFNEDISAWDVSSVTNMFNMFRVATSFNQDIGSWNTSSVTNMSNMFRASVFNQDIGSWDTSSVTNMSSMFYDADAFDQDLSSWDINQVSNFTNFIVNAPGLSTTNYDLLLVGWEANLQAAYPGGSGYPYTININFGGSQYTLGSAAEAARLRLTDPTIFAWTITDGGGV